MRVQLGFGLLEVLIVLALAGTLTITGWQVLPRFSASTGFDQPLQLNVTEQAKLQLLRLQAQQRQLLMQQQGG